MPTSVVLSGGANLGAVHVGMLRALVEADIRPDMIVGTSVGAINGIYMASRWDDAGVDGLDAVWSGMRRSTIFPTRLVGGLLGFIGKRDHLVPPDGLRRLVQDHADIERIADAPISLHVVATDLLTGLDRRFSSGPAVEAVMASAAIPAVFPPVVINGVPYIDGEWSTTRPSRTPSTSAPTRSGSCRQVPHAASTKLRRAPWVVLSKR